MSEKPPPEVQEEAPPKVSPEVSPEKLPEEPTKITAEPAKKEKDPKRVAQGKRLAQISKAAKEKKMRDKIAEETQIDFSLDYRSLLYFSAPCVVFVGLYLYLSQKNHVSPARKPETKDEQPPKTRLVSLFD